MNTKKPTPQYTEEFKKTIVNLYHSGKSYSQLHNEYGISSSALSNWVHRYSEVKIDENTVLLRPDEIARLKESAPYLIAMKVRDLREVPPEESVASDTRIVQIPAPQQEPDQGPTEPPLPDNH